MLRKLITSLYTGPLFVLAWLLATQMVFPAQDPGRTVWDEDLVTSLFLLVSYAYLFTYGLLCSLVIDMLVERLAPRFPSLLRLFLYLLAGLTFYAWLKDSEHFAPTEHALIAPMSCAAIFFAVEEALIRTGWLETHKRWVITCSVLLPIAMSLGTGWDLLE
ncbi:hypothetical protein [Staphylospora marina]|uniref:hypothetical protein n=1 Tax=Staphylospora marina TaxID=2490858 RepID=UPI0013DE60DD|nr:hypothetical protein [Staphylospora marina]